MTESAFYSFKVADASGTEVAFSDFRNKVVVVVNTASLCGFTPQFLDLQSLHDKYSQQGLVILGFPCNQFGGQEPLDGLTIVASCQKNYGVTFPIMDKVLVNGEDTSPLYAWLKQQQPGQLGFEGLRWNFEKFVIDRKGTVVSRHLSAVVPLDFESELVSLLEQ